METDRCDILSIFMHKNIFKWDIQTQIQAILRKFLKVLYS